MKPFAHLALLSLSLVPIAITAAPPEAASAVVDAEELTPAALLAGQIAEIAGSNSLSQESKQKKISALMATAVSSAIAGLTDSNQILTTANNLTIASVKAAPGFASTIGRAVSSLPAIARIQGAAIQIQANIVKALEEVSQVQVAVPAPVLPRPPAAPEFGGRTSDTIVSRSR